MSVEMGMMIHKGTVYLMESDSTKPTRKMKSKQLQTQTTDMVESRNRIYIYDPVNPIQVGIWSSSTGMSFFPGVEDALREGNRDALISCIPRKIS
jgi:hypothetical protein